MIHIMFEMIISATVAAFEPKRKKKWKITQKTHIVETNAVCQMAALHDIKVNMKFGLTVLQLKICQQ